MREIRYLDKLIDELAGGKKMEKSSANRSSRLNSRTQSPLHRMDAAGGHRRRQRGPG